MFRVVSCGLFFFASLCYSTQLTVVTEQWPPFNYVNSNREITGLSTRTVKQVLATANIRYELKLYPWVRAYRIALNTPNVLIYSIFKTKQRTPHFYWFCPLHATMKLYVWRLSERKDINIQSIEDIGRYKIALTRNDYPYFALQNLAISFDYPFDFSPVDELNLKKLLYKRADLILATKPSIYYRLAEHHLRPNILTAQLAIDMPDELCMALNKKSDPYVVKAITQSFNQLKSKQSPSTSN